MIARAPAFIFRAGLLSQFSLLRGWIGVGWGCRASREMGSWDTTVTNSLYYILNLVVVSAINFWTFHPLTSHPQHRFGPYFLPGGNCFLNLVSLPRTPDLTRLIHSGRHQLPIECFDAEIPSYQVPQVNEITSPGKNSGERWKGEEARIPILCYQICELWKRKFWRIFVPEMEKTAQRLLEYKYILFYVYEGIQTIFPRESEFRLTTKNKLIQFWNPGLPKVGAKLRRSLHHLAGDLARIWSWILCGMG